MYFERYLLEYFNLVMISTSLVVNCLNHPPSEEHLPSLGEGDLVELAPAVRQVAVVPVLGTEALLSRTILDVRSSQPGWQLCLTFPSERNVVDMAWLVSKEGLPALGRGQCWN